jgi:hypothetical protein
MATITSSGSGNWSTVVNANDGDDVTIAAGHDVIFDADHTAWSTGLNSLVINGTLKFKSDANTCLMMATNKSITGTGTLGNPVTDPVTRPATGSSYRCRIILNGTGQITTSTIAHYGWKPTLNYTTLSANAAQAATEIILTEDLGVQQGDEIVVGCGNVNGSMAEATKGVYTVQSYDAETKTITLTAGLGTARLAGDYVAWLSRTTNIERNPAGATPLSNVHSGIFEGVRILNTRGPMTVNGWTLKGCTMQNGQYGFITAGAGHLLEDVTGHNIVSGGLIYQSSASTMKKCINFNSGYGIITVGGVIYLYKCVGQNNPSFVNSISGCILSQCVGKNNSTADIQGTYESLIYDGTLSSTTQVTGYRNAAVRKWINNESFDHNDQIGYYRAWMKGGYIYTDNTVYYGSNSDSLKFVIEEDNPVFREYFIYFPENENKKLKIPIRKDFDGGTVKAMIINPKYDPMIDDTQSPLVEATMSDTKNTWEIINLSYKSTDTRLLIVRIIVQNTSGNAWVDVNGLKKYGVERLLQPKKNFIFS